MVGLAIGVTRFVWESSYPMIPCGSEDNDPRPAIIKNVHFLHFGVILFGVVIVVVVAVSLLTKPIDEKHVRIDTVSCRPQCLAPPADKSCRHDASIVHNVSPSFDLPFVVA
jgi:hypothetical protein